MTELPYEEAQVPLTWRRRDACGPCLPDSVGSTLALTDRSYNSQYVGSELQQGRPRAIPFVQ